MHGSCHIAEPASNTGGFHLCYPLLLCNSDDDLVSLADTSVQLLGCGSISGFLQISALCAPTAECAHILRLQENYNVRAARLQNEIVPKSQIPIQRKDEELSEQAPE